MRKNDVKKNVEHPGIFHDQSKKFASNPEIHPRMTTQKSVG